MGSPTMASRLDRYSRMNSSPVSFDADGRACCCSPPCAEPPWPCAWAPSARPSTTVTWTDLDRIWSPLTVAVAGAKVKVPVFLACRM